MHQRSDRPSLYYVEGIQVKKTDQRQAPVDLRSVSPTINTYIQLVRHLLLFLFTGVVTADYELCPGINKPILKASINKQTVQPDFLV